MKFNYYEQLEIITITTIKYIRLKCSTIPINIYNRATEKNKIEISKCE